MKRFAVMSALLAGVFAVAAVAAPKKTNHLSIELIAESSALVPGQRGWIGLHLRHEPHWHTYWVNPGDSGLPTKITWHTPAGVEAGAIAWPVPQRFEVGGLYNFGYSGDVMLPVPVQVGSGVKPGTTARLTADVRWLVCREQCIPGKTTLRLDLPVAASATPNAHWRKTFAAAQAARPTAATWNGSARIIGDHVEIALHGTDLPAADALDAFVTQNQVVGYAPPKVARDGDGLQLVFPKSDYLTMAPASLDLVLVESKAGKFYARSITVPFAAAADSSTAEK